jgi:hypothetical protein
MSWEDQGRQYHGWFGHGTAAAAGDEPSNGGAGAMFDPDNIAARIDAIAYSATAHMPRSDRHRDSVAFDRPRLERLRKVMTAWTGARSLSEAAFGERFVDPSTSGAAIEMLRAAAEGARTATTHEDLADASADLAGAMRDIGLQKWPRFLNDAVERADANGPVVMAQATTPNTAPDARPAGNPAALAPGRYIADNPQQWIGQPSVGTGECVPLVRAATGAPQAKDWQRGVKVQGNTNIRPGTAIATFDSNGHYDGHAAIYLGQDEHGIQVIDQWNRRDSQGRITGQHLPSERALPLRDPRHAAIDRGEFYNVVE